LLLLDDMGVVPCLGGNMFGERLHEWWSSKGPGLLQSSKTPSSFKPSQQKKEGKSGNCLVGVCGAFALPSPQ